MSRKRARVSLCMIVRDSAGTLGPCLQSIRPWVDEIVVVDTGSRDNTREIARRFGARVSEFPWIDDFSAARNESLRLATGEWLFWMDSDDTIPASCGERLRALVDGEHLPSILGYIVQVHCPGEGGVEGEDWTVVDHVKLFRNLPALRFEGRIHEQIIPAIRQLGGEVAWTDLHVVHSGSDSSPAGKQRKYERDLRILRLDLADRPGHPFVLFNLGMTHNDMGEHATAIDWLRQSLAVSHPGESHLRKVYALLASSQTALGMLDDAAETCQQGLAIFPQDAELLFRHGIVLHRQGRCEQALECYRRILRDREARHLSSLDTGIFGFKARHNMALVFAELGRHDLAELQWRLCLEESPKYPAAWSALAESLIRQRKFATVEELQGRFPNTPSLNAERLWLPAEAAMARQDYLAVASFLEVHARTLGKEVRYHHLKCHYLFECGDLSAAQSALEELSEQAPDCPMTLHNLGLVYFRQGKLPDAAVALTRSLALRPHATQTRQQLHLIEQALAR